MTTNPNKIGTLSASAVTEIEDGTDSIHTGLIKVLNQQAIGSFISKGFNVHQANTQFQINGNPNEWFDRGEFKSNNTFSPITDDLVSGTLDYYAFLAVVEEDNTVPAGIEIEEEGAFVVKKLTSPVACLPILLLTPKLEANFSKAESMNT